MKLLCVLARPKQSLNSQNMISFFASELTIARITSLLPFLASIAFRWSKIIHGITFFNDLFFSESLLYDIVQLICLHEDCLPINRIPVIQMPAILSKSFWLLIIAFEHSSWWRDQHGRYYEKKLNQIWPYFQYFKSQIFKSITTKIIKGQQFIQLFIDLDWLWMVYPALQILDENLAKTLNCNCECEQLEQILLAQKHETIIRNQRSEAFCNLSNPHNDNNFV